MKYLTLKYLIHHFLNIDCVFNGNHFVNIKRKRRNRSQSADFLNTLNGFWMSKINHQDIHLKTGIHGSIDYDNNPFGGSSSVDINREMLNDIAQRVASEQDQMNIFPTYGHTFFTADNIYTVANDGIMCEVGYCNDSASV